MPFKNNLKDVDYFLDQMGHGIKNSFTEEQEKHIRLVLSKAIRVPSKKMIDLNVPFWFFKKYYLQLYVGEDKRRDSRQPHNIKSSENIIDRDYNYFYNTLPKDILDSLNYEQKRAVQDILKRCIAVPTKKIYETNKTFKFFGKYCYLSFFLGFDKRKGQRVGSNNMHGLNMGVRGFIYLLELAIAVGIIYAIFHLVSSLITFNPAAAIDEGTLDEMIDEKMDERINQGYCLPNPLQIIDYYWWIFLKPLF
jgi:hypothetical protein